MVCILWYVRYDIKQQGIICLSTALPVPYGMNFYLICHFLSELCIELIGKSEQKDCTYRYFRNISAVFQTFFLYRFRLLVYIVGL
jgi:hypothetical protein